MARTRGNHSFSLILPAYNEERTIEKTLRAACGTSVQEIIVIDDGSTDATAEIVMRIQALDQRIVLCRHRRNRGPGAARKTGAKSAIGSVLVFFDCDIENITPCQIQALMNPFETGSVDLVMADFDNFGRVTEYLVRPLLERFVPSLVTIKQPLSGMFAISRDILSLQTMEVGHAVSGILLEAYFKKARIAQVYIGEIHHRKRDDASKAAQASSECSAIVKMLIENGVIQTALR